MNLSKQTEGVPPRSGWRLSGQHQLAIALLATTGLVVFGFFYGWSVWQGDQDDIDQASATPGIGSVKLDQLKEHLLPVK